MVKLIFNPEKNGNVGITSKTSKKRIANLNPFTFFENEIMNFDKLNLNDELNLKDLVGLENTHYILNKWYTSEGKPLLIIGPTGCGKTSLVELYCKENDIMLYTIRINDLVKTKKELIREIIAFSEYSSTSFFIKSNNTSKKLLFFDEYQNGPNDLLGITDIIQLLDLKLPPIVIISSDSKGSKLNDLKKISEVYYIGEINHSVIFNWVNSLYKNLDQKILMEIIKKCKSDKRLILNLLSFLKTNLNISVETFINTFYKDADINIFDYTSKLFDSLEQVNINDIFKIYDSDGFMIANLVQENYLDYNDSIESIARSADAISLGETIFSDTYESSRTFIPNTHCINAVILPSYFSRFEFKKNRCPLRTNCNNNRFNIYLNNKKNMNKIIFASNNKLNIFDILYIKKFLNQELIKNKNITNLQENFLKNLLNTFPDSKIEKLEYIYKYFSEFKDLGTKEIKTKNFTLKFKEKLNKLINGK